MTEMHLKKPEFTYNACGPFTKNKEWVKEFKETGNSRYFYQNELDKGCFQHDMTYGDFKGLNSRTAADKVLRDKTFNIAKNPKDDGYQCWLASVVYKFFDKKTFRCDSWKWNYFWWNEIISNKELSEELHKPIIRKFEKRKVDSSFIIQYLGC